MGGRRAEGSLKLKLLQLIFWNGVSKVTEKPLWWGCSFILNSCQHFDLTFTSEDLKLPPSSSKKSPTKHNKRDFNHTEASIFTNNNKENTGPIVKPPVLASFGTGLSTQPILIMGSCVWFIRYQGPNYVIRPHYASAALLSWHGVSLHDRQAPVRAATGRSKPAGLGREILETHTHMASMAACSHEYLNTQTYLVKCFFRSSYMFAIKYVREKQ